MNNSKNTEKNRLSLLLLRSDASVSVLVVILGFIFGTILILCVGRNPIGMYKAILQVLTGWNIDRGSMNLRYVGEWLNMSIPLILCGLSMALPARAGLFNIGGEGQYIVGLTVAQVIALLGPQVSILHWILALTGAIIIGAVWGGIVGFLKAKFEVSEVVATIMLNYIALYLSRIIIMNIPGTNTYRTVAYPETVSIESGWIAAIFNGSMLDKGFFFMLIAVAVYWFLMEKTNVGFSLRATGFNKDASRCSGINVVKSIVISMAVAGAFAGLAGGLVAIGSFSYGRVISGMDNYGFTGIAVALVGNNTAIGTLLAGLLFGMLSSAQPLMQAQRIPKEITFIIQGLIVIFIAIREGIRIFIRWRMKKENTVAAHSVQEEKK